MTVDEGSKELAQLNRLVAWIDEQRKADRDAIVRLNSQVERLGGELRENASQCVALQDQLRQSQASVSRLPVIDAGLRQVREQLTDVQRQLQELDQRENRSGTVQQAEQTRVSKSLADVAQQISELFRRGDTCLNRLQLLGEEIKHDRGAVAPLPQRIEYLEKQWSGVTGRSQLLEEQLKRVEGQVATLDQMDESLQAEQKRVLEWQRSTELRWARQLAEWERHMEQWQRLLDDQVKAVQELLGNATQNKQGLEELRRELAEQHDQMQLQISDTRRMESAGEVAREEVYRLLQGLEAQRRRVDEQAGLLRQAEESIQQGINERLALSGRLDNERERVDTLMSEMRQREQEERERRGEWEHFQQEYRTQRYELKDGFGQLAQELAMLRQEYRDRLAELIVLHERDRLRQIADLEQQLRELRELDDAIGAKQN